MFDAGRTNLFALCSNITWPLSSETIFTAKKPGSSAGCLTISSMRDCSSVSVPGAFFAGTTATGVVETVGDCALTPRETKEDSRASVRAKTAIALKLRMSWPSIFIVIIRLEKGLELVLERRRRPPKIGEQKKSRAQNERGSCPNSCHE